VDDRRYLFNPLGSNTQLFTRSVHDDDFATRVAPTQVPEPINRRALDRDLQQPLNQQVYFGPGKSLNIGGVTADKLHVCDLSDLGQGWAHTPAAGTVAIDPALGRIAFARRASQPSAGVVSLRDERKPGGGEYDREDSIDPLLQPVQKVPAPQAKIQAALDAVNKGGAVPRSATAVTTPKRQDRRSPLRAWNRAADGTRPTLTLAAELVITGGERSRGDTERIGHQWRHTARRRDRGPCAAATLAPRALHACAGPRTGAKRLAAPTGRA
jgi:hypothetical protein